MTTVDAMDFSKPHPLHPMPMPVRLNIKAAYCAFCSVKVSVCEDARGQLLMVYCCINVTALEQVILQGQHIPALT